jgi:hypothetical protein
MKLQLCCLLALALVAFAACGAGRSPTDVTRAYLRAIAEVDGKRACGFMTGNFRRVTVESSPLEGATCEQSIERFSRLIGEESRSLLRKAEISAEGSGAPGAAWVRIDGGAQTPLRGELVTLHEINGEWRIDSRVAPEA